MIKHIKTWLSQWIESHQREQRHQQWVENRDYHLIDDDLNIVILRGKYAGVEFKFGQLNMVDDYGHATFDFDIIPQEGYDNNVLKNDKSLAKTIKTIMLVILEDALDNYNALRKEVLNDDGSKDRDNYSEESTIPRTVREKGAAVYQSDDV